MFAFENVNKMLLIVLFVIEFWSITTSREEAGKENKEPPNVQKNSPAISRRDNCLCGDELRRKNV